jgi:hypothetical protein
MSATDFVPADFDVPIELVSRDFRLIPLGPEHNAADYAAWTSSMEHIRSTPGFTDRRWPAPMEAEENLRDLQGHQNDFRQREGFTYTVLDPHDDVIGCVYIYPATEPDVDADVRSWVRADHGHLDRDLYDAVSTWLRNSWPFGTVAYAKRDPSSDP